MALTHSLFKRSGEAFIYSSLFIGLIAITLTLSSYLILSNSIFNIPGYILGLVFSGSVIIYNLNIFSLPVSIAVSSIREKWKVENKRIIKLLLIISAFSIVWFSHYFSFNTILFLSHLALLSMFYVMPVTIKGKALSLRNLPLLKIFILSYVWASVTVLLPAMEMGMKDSSNVLFLFVERFLFIFAMTIPFDVRDFAKDKKVGLITIPGMLGICRSLHLSKFLLTAFVVISFAVSGISYVSVSRLICALVGFVFISKVNLRKKDFFYLIGLDGLMILQFLILYIIKLIMN